MMEKSYFLDKESNRLVISTYSKVTKKNTKVLFLNLGVGKGEIILQKFVFPLSESATILLQGGGIVYAKIQLPLNLGHAKIFVWNINKRVQNAIVPLLLRMNK